MFAGAVSRTGGEADTRNNVESVYLPAGTTGRFTVSVKGLNVADDGVPGNADATDQDYALVVSNADEQTAPVLTHSATTVDDAAPGGDGDGALEPDEQIAADRGGAKRRSPDRREPDRRPERRRGLNVTQPARPSIT